MGKCNGCGTGALVMSTALALGGTWGCENQNDEGVSTAASAASAAIMISGDAVDSSGRALSGVTVQLAGTQQATAITSASGVYEFTALNAGPYSLMPSRSGCAFSPSVVNLGDVTSSRTQNFTGTGASCVGTGTPGVPTAPATATNKGATDPGPRPGPAGAGAPATPQPINADSASAQAAAAAACFPGLSATMQKLCEQAVIRFQEVDSVSGTVGTESGVGLGPTFNANSCAACHAQPAALGTSPGLNSPQNPVPNPQVAFATLDGARNTLPSFITAAGPVREARFKTDGGVHGLFTIAGRSDAPGCNATQPDFASAVAANNVIFRIPTPTFGGGLVENVPEMELEANLQKSTDAALGIAGTLNRTGNDGTITRFGWKAQNKSLLIFAGEAYNVEQGVTNLNFPDEREDGASNLQACMSFNTTPEDNTNFSSTGTASDIGADVLNFALAMQLSKPATPALPPGVSENTVTQGSNQFVNIGCGNCHTPTLTTAGSTFDPALSNVTFHPYSDFAVHNMGTGLSDGISQGNAGPQQFRSAPLWGVGQRLFFLHDGRTSDLTVAIAAHASTGSEANAVINNFNNLSASDQQAVIDFLRSL